jgi:hypothetical protein
MHVALRLLRWNGPRAMSRVPSAKPWRGIKPWHIGYATKDGSKNQRPSCDSTRAFGP